LWPFTIETPCFLIVKKAGNKKKVAVSTPRYGVSSQVSRMLAMAVALFSGKVAGASRFSSLSFTPSFSGDVLAIREGAVKASLCTQPKTQDLSSEKYGVKEADGGCGRFDSVTAVTAS